MIHTNRYLSAAYTYFNFSGDNEFIIAFGIAVIGVIAATNIFLAFVTFVINFFSARRFYSLTMRFLEKYLRQPYVFYLNSNTADLSKKILSDVFTVINLLIRILNLISSSLVSLAIIILLIIINPLLALAVSGIFGILYLLIYSLVKKFLDKKGKEKNVQNKLRYKYINETFGGIKDVKILGKEKVFLSFNSGPAKKYAHNDALCEIISDIPKYVLEVIVIGGIVGVIAFMVHSGIKLDSFLPVLTVYAFGAYRLLPSLQKIFRAVTSIKYNLPVLEGLHRDYTKLPPGEALANEDIPKLDFRKTIALENISFSYPNTSKDVIKSQSLVIEANTSIALVGATGCGKTTLVDIILGLLEPQTGAISIDGQKITGANRKNWQRNLGYVPQSIYLTDDTIRNNIAFGIAPDKIDDQAVIQAAKLANIHDFIIKELEESYDTVIGERGIRLSGGQRQRIGIARAVYHNPSVLILDEATSALDGLTENAIMDAIQTMSRKKTIIMIAHRITTVKGCDVIYFMDKGTIVDSGNYDELYQKNESFRKMADGNYKE
ncbi:ABC transporter ATP-binding protein [Spirochaetia bacterium]|nr:ABC transporter ATP-binding protein [Spirochaetia bacterium]